MPFGINILCIVYCENQLKLVNVLCSKMLLFVTFKFVLLQFLLLGFTWLLTSFHQTPIYRLNVTFSLHYDQFQACDI